MTTQDILTIMGMNIALFAALAGMVYWMVNRIDTDVKGVYTRLDKMDNRFDGHAQRIDQLYKMFVDLLKERK
jgi:hypothetical protein